MLHPAHNEGHFWHVHSVGHDTAARLSNDFQSYARTRGLPAPLVDQLHVRYDEVSGEMRPGVKDPAFRDELNEWEYGNLEHGPTGIMSNFLNAAEPAAMEYYGQAMLHRMSAAM